MEIIERLDLKSSDIKDDQINKLKQIFPEAFTEGNKIDWDRLRLSLGENIDTGKERYGMNWPGKADCFRTIQQSSIATLVPDREESVNFDTTENLFIEGDNLEVLKLLQKSYLGKIKMIYIDPPYNTGNDFIYPDNYTENLQTYLEYTGQVDSEGRKFGTNTDTDGRFHSKWMNMMYPRLFLAKNLLRDDGVIFISIDDNEVQNLRALCNEILGEENFIAQLIWKRRQNVDSRAKNGASVDHEYIVVYKKAEFATLRGAEKDLDKYSNPDNDPKGPWMSDNMVGLATKEQRPNLHYDLENPESGIIYKCPPTGWRYEPKRMKELLSKGEVIFPKGPEGRPRRKKFLQDLTSEFTGFSSILHTVFNTQGTREFREIFDDKDFFDFPKPKDFIKLLLSQGTDNESPDIVLDFFAGSSTTAHAVMDLNKEDTGNRKFICVQLPEPTDENSEAYRAGYRSIADIGKERIRRVIKKISTEIYSEKQKPQQLQLGEDPKQEVNIDLGFKVFKLKQSNFKIWQESIEKTPEAIQTALELHIDHISPEAQQEAILFELLLKSGFELTTPIQQLILEGKTVFSVAEGQLLICLEKELTHELIKAMAELQPVRVICLDEGFHNDDQLKTNAVQIMKSKGVTNFRTV
jgi:adenine-specific DNA-methyltransferase